MIGLPFFLAIMIAHIAPTTATTTQTMMMIVAVFIGYFSLRSVNLQTRAFSMNLRAVALNESSLTLN